MSELLIGNIPAPTGTNGRVPQGVPESAKPANDGKAEPAAGNPLPVSNASEEKESAPEPTKLSTVALSIGRDLKFIVDLDSAQSIIQVLDSETGELIRQIPSASLSTYPLSDGSQAIRLLDTFA